MKRLVLFELILIFFATTFERDSPPGWFQQSISLGNKLITDIQFLDSLNGWAVTDAGPSFDTAYVFRTNNGGLNWDFQYRFPATFYKIQMIDYDTGYIAGSTGFGKMWKTTNGGINWNIVSNFSASPMTDLHFVNVNTGWICSDDILDGGVFKTINGGVNWQTQLGVSFKPAVLFFLNKDTGWTGTREINGKLYRTTNSGDNWSLQYTFPQQINDIFYFNSNIGIVSSGFNHRTTDGGFSWTQSNIGSIKISKGSDSIVWAGTNSFQRIRKSSDGGVFWYSQASPIGNNSYTSAIDSLTAWAGGNGLVHTTDGGGPPIGILYASSEVSNYKLDQNFPNPFNPTTIIFFKLQEKSTVELIVYNLLGEEVTEMVDDDHFTAGVYQFGFDASKYDLPSGVYFYRLTAKSETSDYIFIDTKKMILVK